jgi:multiple antibiotic resistance protein
MEFSDLIYATTLLFFIFDPFASLPIFITLTKSFSDEDKMKSANKAILVAAILFVIFVFVGKELLAASASRRRDSGWRAASFFC